MEQRQERINVMLQKVEFDDDKLSTGDAVLAQWSKEAVELSQIVKQLGVIPEVCVEDYILNFFKELSVQKQQIIDMDPTLARFTSLKVLNLSFNQISRVEFLPPNLEELYLNGNEVNEISLSVNKPYTKLVHLGLSMNQIRQPALVHIVKVFPNLFCLDVSFNDICEMGGALSWISKLTSLKMLSLEGNPLVLTPDYMNQILFKMPQLKVVDGSGVPLEATKAALEAQANSKAAALASKLSTGRSGRSKKEDTESTHEDMVENTTLDIEFRLLRNIEGGRYLIPDQNCVMEPEKLDELTDEQKSSQYWLSYHNHGGQEVTTEKKSYIKHFQVEENENKPGSSIAKTDFDFKLRLDEPPSIALRDWFYKDVIVTFWESRPKFAKVKEEGSDVAVDRAVLDPETQIPEIEQINHGIMKINMMHWLKRSPLNPKYSTAQKNKDKTSAEPVEQFIQHKFHHFYPQEWLDVPEFMYENNNDVIKRKDKELLIKYLEDREQREKEKAAKAAEEAASGANNAAAAAPGKKADPKKDAKGGAKPAKGAVAADDKNSPQNIQVTYEEIPEFDNFMIFERKYNAVPKEAAPAKKSTQPAAAGATGAKAAPAGKDRSQELTAHYKILRAKPYSVAVLLKLNQPIPVEPEPVDEPEVPVVEETKKKGKK